MRSPCAYALVDRLILLLAAWRWANNSHQLTAMCGDIARIIFRSSDFSSVLRLIYYLFMIRLLAHTWTHCRTLSTSRCPTIDFSLVDSMNLGSLALRLARMANSVAKQRKQQTLHSRSPPTHAKKEWKERERKKTKKTKKKPAVSYGEKRLYSAIKSLALHCGASFAWYNRFQITAFHETTGRTHTHGRRCHAAWCVFIRAFLMLNVWASAINSSLAREKVDRLICLIRWLLVVD